jgi:hypothetical protein
MDDFDAGPGTIHVHGEQKHQVERQADHAVSLFSLIFDKVAFPCDEGRIAENFRRRLEGYSVHPKISSSLRGVPRESHLPLSLFYDVVNRQAEAGEQRRFQQAALAQRPDACP